MGDEKTLKDALISAFEHLKSQDALLSAVILDVAALRESLLERNPEAIVRHLELLAAKTEEAKPKIVASAQVFDEIIRVLKGGAVWTN